VSARAFPPAYAYLVAAAAAIGVFVAHSGGAFGTGLYSAIGASGVVAILAGARRMRREARLPWLAFAAGVALIVTGDTVYSARDLLGWSNAVPGWADSFYLVAYPFLAAGLFVLVRPSRGGRMRTTLMDAGIVGLALVLVLWRPFFTQAGSDASLAERVTLSIYPGWDLVLLVLATTFVFRRSLGSRWAQLLVLAVLALLAADFLWAVVPDGYTAGDWMDRLWLASYTLWGAAALHPSARRADEGQASEWHYAWHRLAALGLPVLAMPAVFLYSGVGSGWQRAGEVALGTLVVALLLLRLSETVLRLDVARGELAQHNRRLAESEERFRRTFSDAPVPMTILAPDGTVAAVNKTLLDAIGLSEDELVGRSFLDYVAADDREESLSAFAAGLEAGAWPPAERRFVRGDGAIMWALTNLSRLPDGSLIGHVQDISDRKRYEAELQDADRQKDELISVVSHDLRTPLTSIVGYLELALEAGDEPGSAAERDDFLRVAQRNAERLSRLVEDLLFVSRAQAGRAQLEPEPVDAGELVTHVVEAALPAATAAGITIAQHGDGVTVLADSHRLSEAVENLLSNAIKFTPAGGRVDVTVESWEDEVAIAVADTGRGLSEVDRTHVFERFFRAEGSEGVPGAGLGLAIVKAIVEAHGGAVLVRSAPGEGATFELRLPRARAEAPAAA
jgi:PAS domain S-box-containing protein